jgi:hypothetical protein
MAMFPSSLICTVGLDHCACGCTRCKWSHHDNCLPTFHCMAMLVFLVHAVRTARTDYMGVQTHTLQVITPCWSRRAVCPRSTTGYHSLIHTHTTILSPLSLAVHVDQAHASERVPMPPAVLVQHEHPRVRRYVQPHGTRVTLCHV